MANKPRMKMSAADRAKQFMPFSALKGLDEALHEKERIVVEKAELSEESAENIANTLKIIEKGTYVSVVYYSDGEYVSAEGIVTELDKTFRKMTVVKKEICFDDIYKILVSNNVNKC